MRSRTLMTRPRFEPLEDRTLMSTCHVTRLSDAGVGKGFRGDLRYCINKVNAEPGPDAIDFTVTGTINLSGQLPNLASEIKVDGPGADQLSIDANQNGRVFRVAAGNLVEMTGLTITGGEARNKEPGGGIYNEGTLRLNSCAIVANEGTGYGGGIYNVGSLRIWDSSVMDNSVYFLSSGIQSWGAGIYNGVGGSLEVADAIIAGNDNIPCYSCRAMGGGIANLGSALVQRTAITENSAHPTSVATIGGFGGGIYNGGNLTVESSLIAENIASGDWIATGGGISNGFEYGVGGTVTVSNSTIANNLAWISGEDPQDNPTGGGISSDYGGTVTVSHSTIARNSSQGGMPGFGGGISLTNTDFHVTNSILGENFALNGADINGSLTTSGFNLVQNSTGGDGYSSTDILDVNPMLGQLLDNGGLTKTIALLPGSPAIDAGDNTDAPEWDQRGPGFPRIVNGTIDIGAFEVQATGAPMSPDRLALLITANFESDDWETSYEL